MDSSTWPRGSSRQARIAGVLVALAVGPPIVWLMMVEVGYVAAYGACADRTNGWVHKPNVVFIVLSIGCAGVAWWLHRKLRSNPAPVGFLAGLALLMAGLTAIVVIASAIPALILHPCD
jgi:cytochrome bd-type quinol oxidase subunit 2